MPSLGVGRKAAPGWGSLRLCLHTPRTDLLNRSAIFPKRTDWYYMTAGLPNDASIFKLLIEDLRLTEPRRGKTLSLAVRLAACQIPGTRHGNPT